MGDTAVMPPTSPLSRQQLWLVRHGRGVLIGCVVFLAAMVVSAIYNFAEHDVSERVISIVICWSPLGMIAITRFLDRAVATRAGHAAGPDRPPS